MTNSLATTTTTLLISDKARLYQSRSKAASTLGVYRSALRDFEDFCRATGSRSAPAEVVTVVEYLAFLADEQSVSTIRVKLAAIARAHRIAHLPDPTVDDDVKTAMAGIAREKGKPPVPKQPATLDVIKEMVATLPDTITGARDRAIILIGFGGMFRRSELVNLTIDDVALSGQRLTLMVQRGKTDQEGHGLKKHFTMLDDKTICPVRALQAWLSQSGLKRGPLFRGVDRWGKVRSGKLSTQTIADVVKHAAAAAGHDPAMFAGHSLRRGGITSAFDFDAEERDVMNQSGHTDPKTVRHYNDDAGKGATKAFRAAFGEK